MIAIAPKPEEYQAQLEQKIQQLCQSFSVFELPGIDIFPSPPLHFRHRAEFAIWHQGNTCHYAVFPQGKKNPPQFITDFPIASERINALMLALLPRINTNPHLKEKLFQVNFHSTTTGDALISLIYHKNLNEDWYRAARELDQQLSASVVGRSRKQKLVVGADYVTEEFTISNKTVSYCQPENFFTQSNASICQHMLTWVTDQLQTQTNQQSDLLELYCGNGNFTLAMAPYRRRILATELVKQLVRVAKENCQLNAIDNVEVVRLAADEVVAAINKVRPFRRLQHIDMDRYNFTTLFVDPPRAGLDASCLALAEQFTEVIYISCNPETLHRDLLSLARTHAIVKMAVFDQFPYTYHLECGVSLRKR